METEIRRCVSFFPKHLFHDFELIDLFVSLFFLRMQWVPFRDIFPEAANKLSSSRQCRTAASHP